MIIDKKREEMFFRCRMRKKKLDTKLNVVKALLVLPPAFFLVSKVVEIIMSMFGDAASMATGALFYGYNSGNAPFSSLLFIIGSAVLFLSAICITIFDTEEIKKHILKIYPSIALLFIIFGIVFKDVELYIIVAMAVLALPLGLYNNTLKKEDLAMSKLEGYTHFNPIYMENRDTSIPKVTKEEFDGMTDDERIMFERDGGRKR